MCSWALSTNIGYSLILVQHLKCHSSSSKTLLACLKGKTAEEIVEFSKKIKVREGILIFFFLTNLNNVY